MTDDVLASQAAYYRRRAAEYDATAYGDLAAARTRIDRLVDEMQPAGTVLEIACGTGMWTGALARSASNLTAMDVAPEAVAIARKRVAADNVRFEIGDIFTWQTAQRFDVIFFSAWLSHVPSSRFDEFWNRLRGLLADGGRVLFIDEHVVERGKETYLPGEDEIVARRLEDGTDFRIVKNFVDPDALVQRLSHIGWHCRVRRDGTEWVWVCGEAHPV